MIPNPLRLLWAIWAWLLVLPTLAIAAVPILVLPRLAHRRAAAGGVCRAYFALVGLPIAVRGIELLPPGACIIVANHASYVDGPLLFACLPPRFGFVIKKEASRIPLAGVLLRRLGHHFVERRNRHEGASDARRILRAVEDGQAVAFFPEGTFVPEPGLGRFHSGAFAAAARSGVPVAPVAIRGTRRVLGGGTIVPRWGRIEVEVLAPLAGSMGAGDAAVALRDAAHRAISDAVGEQKGLRNAGPARSIASSLLIAATYAVVAAFASVYGISEWKMRRSHDAPLALLAPAITADPVEGERMARIVGCLSGCHGREGQGGFEEIEGIHRRTAPTLSEVVPQYDDPELVRLIRYGVKRDGKSAMGMASYAFWPLGDQDLANIIACLRRLPASEPVPRVHDLPLRGRWALVTGEWRVSAEQVDRSIPRWGELPRRTPFERGRYLASIVCAECHGLDFRGNALEGGPSLVVLAAYRPEQFQTLMQTGTPIDGRALPAMDWLPEVDLTDRDIADLYAFLREYHGLPAAPPEGTVTEAQ